MPFLAAALGLGAIALFALLKPRGTAPGGSGSLPPSPRDTGAVSVFTPRGTADIQPAPPKDLLGLAGYIGGALAGASAFTNTAKSVALPVGLAVAGAAALAAMAAGTSAVAAAGIWAIPVVLVTVAIVTIIDGITRAAQADRWRVLCVAIARMRASGDIPGAQALWRKAKEEVSDIAEVWPQPGESWYNTADPLGRPYPGFPDLPAPATAEELERWPHLIPDVLETLEGTPDEVAGGAALPWLPLGRTNINALLTAFESDVEECRAWGLANGVEGVTYGPGEASKPASSIARYVTFGKATKGPRDLRGWKPLQDRLKALAELRQSLTIAIPWLGPSAWTRRRGGASDYERALDAALATANEGVNGKTLTVVDGVVVKSPPAKSTGGRWSVMANNPTNAVSERQVVAVTRVTGLTGPAAVQVAQDAQAEAQGAARETVAGRAQDTGSEADETETGGARGGRSASNNSGSGGRNA